MEGGLSPEILWRLGPLAISATLVTSWVVLAALFLCAWILSRRLRVSDPGPVQTAVEGLLTLAQEAVESVLPGQAERVLPFVATLWVYLVTANLAGLLPGVHAPTRDLSATSALAILVFLSVHWFGIRARGLRAYLRHYLTPFPLLLPFHLLGEVTRTVALAVRLFGNMMSLEMAALLVLALAGFLVPVPILMLHIIEALVQAYIFGMLALLYIAGGVQSQQPQPDR